MKHLKINILINLAVLASAGTASATNTNSSALIKQNTDTTAVENYWTPERMRDAKPMPLPETNGHSAIELPTQEEPQNHQSGDGAPPSDSPTPGTHQLFKPMAQLDVNGKPTPDNAGTSNAQFSSSRLVPLSADQAYPYSTVGKLFFTIPNRGNFVCSASVLRPRVLLTAGHCVHSGTGGSNGFYTNWLFVPAFRDGAAPYQSWTWAYAAVTGSWASGGGGVPNSADYAMLQLNDRSFSGVTRTIGSVTGYLGYMTQKLIPNHVLMLGYPCNLDSCQKMHQVAAQSSRAVSPNNAEYGSDMSGGSSGGPWVQNFGALATGQTAGTNTGLNRVVGVTSYGYTNTTTLAQGSSILNSQFTNLLTLICNRRAGNC